MAKRKKVTTPSLIPQTEKTEVIPSDLEQQWGAVQACATACNVLDKGHYQHQFLAAVRMTREFLVKLHEQSVEQAIKHPQAHMISELKEILEAKNGQA